MLDTIIKCDPEKGPNIGRWVYDAWAWVRNVITKCSRWM